MMWTDLNQWGLARTHLISADGWVVWRGLFDSNWCVFKFDQPLVRYWHPSEKAAKKFIEEGRI